MRKEQFFAKARKWAISQVFYLDFELCRTKLGSVTALEIQQDQSLSDVSRPLNKAAIDRTLLT
jgi:hypothetical protein